MLVPESTTNVLRIVGGRDAKPGEYPYAVRLEKHQLYIYNKTSTRKFSPSIHTFCSGAALSPTWTLTAAHCYKPNWRPVVSKNISTYTLEIRTMVRYGTPHKKPSEVKNLCAVLEFKSVPHRHGTKYDDIGLIHTEPLIVDSYGKISTFEYKTPNEHEVAVVGFGLVKENSDEDVYKSTFKLDKPLQVMDAMLRTCATHELSSIRLCAVPQSGKIQFGYFGDSGAPVVHATGIVGVVHGGHKYTDTERNFQVHTLTLTPVALYWNWISTMIKN